MEEKIFEPTLQDDESYRDLSSYNISALFVLAFIGGIVPNVRYSLKNAKKLKLDDIQRRKMKVLGLGACLMEFAALGVCYRLNNIYAIAYVLIASRLVSGCLYAYYYILMKPKYKVVKFFHGTISATVPVVIGWSFVGYHIELLMTLLAGAIVSSF